MTDTAKMTTTTKNGFANANDVSVEDLSKQINALKSDLATLTESVSDYTKSRTSEMTAAAKARAKEAAQTGRDKAIEAQQYTEDFIRTQPATALGIAAGLGFLIGMVTARR